MKELDSSFNCSLGRLNGLAIYPHTDILQLGFRAGYIPTYIHITAGFRTGYIPTYIHTIAGFRAGYIPTYIHITAGIPGWLYTYIATYILQLGSGLAIYSYLHNYQPVH